MEYTDEQKAEILAEYDRRRANNERAKDIEANFKKRGIARTFQNWRTQMKKPATTSTPQEPPMPEETVEVLPGQMELTQEPRRSRSPAYGRFPSARSSWTQGHKCVSSCPLKRSGNLPRIC